MNIGDDDEDEFDGLDLYDDDEKEPAPAPAPAPKPGRVKKSKAKTETEVKVKAKAKEKNERFKSRYSPEQLFKVADNAEPKAPIFRSLAEKLRNEKSFTLETASTILVEKGFGPASEESKWNENLPKYALGYLKGAIRYGIIVPV